MLAKLKFKNAKRATWFVGGIILLNLAIMFVGIRLLVISISNPETLVDYQIIIILIVFNFLLSIIESLTQSSKQLMKSIKMSKLPISKWNDMFDEFEFEFEFDKSIEELTNDIEFTLDDNEYSIKHMMNDE